MKNNDASNDNGLINEFIEFHNEMDVFKNNVEEYFNSTNFLLQSLFLDCEINNPKSLLKNLQDLSLELLVFIQKVCEKHDIVWWIDFGNLLGAIRHKGYVPWDDDVDIGMMRTDYLKFDDIIASEIKNHGLSEILEVGYRSFRSGISKFIQVYVKHELNQSNGNRVIIGNVDVFPYEYIKEFDENTISDVYLNVKNEYLNLRESGHDLNIAFDTYYEKLNLSWQPTDYVIPGWESSANPDDLYKLFVIETANIFPLKEITFENYIFPCPNDCDSYLKKIYKDYMSVPKVLRHHDNVSHFYYNDNNNEVFNKCLNMLKNANENFD